MAILPTLYDAILDGNATAATETTQTSLAAGVNPQSLVDDTMIPAMNEVGQRFERSEYFVPELLLAARAMKSALELIRPLLTASGVQPVGRVVLGTVKGDQHDIGKNLVGAMLEGGGYEVIDLGVNVAPEHFVAAVQARKAQFVALSALLTTTRDMMKVTIEALTKAGLRDQVKVLVGGAPIDEAFAQSIGADGYGESAASVVALAKRVAA